MSNTSHGGSVVAASRWTLIEKDKKNKLGRVCENWWDFTVYRSNFSFHQTLGKLYTACTWGWGLHAK